MSADDFIIAAISRIPTVGHQLATFIRMDGVRAVVNIGPNTISVPAVGFYPPMAGMSVQLERRNGSLVLTGPAKQLNPIGTMLSTGTPKADVEIDGVTYTLGMRDGYTPVIGDTVEINPATAIIQGKVTAYAAPEAPEAANAQPTFFKNLLVMATDSGNYWSGGGKWNLNDPWASTNNRGAWFYGNRIKQALQGANVTSAEVYLPAIARDGDVQLNLHGYASKPGGSPTFTSASGVNARGWVRLPAGFLTALLTGGGVGVTSSNGMNKFRGTNGDKLSGAMRFSGYRN